jgi:hypothetical protein
LTWCCSSQRRRQDIRKLPTCACHGTNNDQGATAAHVAMHRQYKHLTYFEKHLSCPNRSCQFELKIAGRHYSAPEVLEDSMARDLPASTAPRTAM